MKVGLLSDSHGELENLRRAAKVLADQVELIVHLGDDWDDCRVLEEMGLKFIRVPGVFSSYYQAPQIANRRIEKFNHWKVLLSHTSTSHKNDLPQDMKPEVVVARREVDVVLYGHTHIPKIEKSQGILWVNPGHLKPEDRKGYSPSYAILDFGPQEVWVRIFGLEKGEILAESEIRDTSHF